ncbi:hypothetical protein ASF53_14135 [Methylobacterium sp. Leaf123]|uniref:DUF2075 domain-containing protein n=1 Tax=Methylobacterium sp. Leaf123 TaxID=1736264 RepID=UPI0007018982|nr:DUF2075 domain-containing protein [Methylobacterium sp. Leaf123]KQQ13305.1 hypothetical protein ASF53_14135 [Methylobacterium sp. Leaf123]
MTHGYASTLREFITADEDAIVGRLVDGVAATGIDRHRNTQIDAWRREVRLLKAALGAPGFREWFIVLEYELPRRARRPDCILLSPHTIFVIEFKVGADAFDAASCWQTSAYALDIRDFHAQSHGRRIVPILCATEAPDTSTSRMFDPIRTNGRDLAAIVTVEDERAPSVDALPIDPIAWMGSAYRPTPTVVEAAVRLYEGHGVRELSHRHAHNLDRTVTLIAEAIDQARTNSLHLVCFVTGIPGAGKTLTGLDVVHDPSVRGSEGYTGIFLSGNGPLVKIVREALVMNRVAKGDRRRDCEREITTFIQNVHQFLRFHRENPAERPHEHVVVFDEAQRAWDRAQMKRKQAVDASEAELLLGVMERLPDWAVIVALVGGGQEIYLGEAGLAEWGNALATRERPWRVIASPEVLAGGSSVAGHRLFEGDPPPNVSVRAEPDAHLAVGVRSHRAERWAEWVDRLLDLDVEAARVAFPPGAAFPCHFTRDLGQAKAWLRAQKALDPDLRIGLVSTSEDLRLRAHGIEASSAFRMDYAFDKWFLALDEDVRASGRLEVAASEFECQGLELDWVCLCWGADLTPTPARNVWEPRKFRGSKWQNVYGDAERRYVANRYRVLLTRARRGMIIWVPPGDSTDPTRDPDRFDRVALMLYEAGVPELSEVVT